jgi:3-oxoacyl-[acyl-carrier protein] reductase
MARKLSKEVRINTLAPGNIFFENGSWDEKLREDPERIKMIIDNTVPMQRFGTLDEVSDAALFLCSNRASFISGCTLVVDGGQTVSVL